jgi:hypothetical protein
MGMSGFFNAGGNNSSGSDAGTSFPGDFQATGAMPGPMGGEVEINGCRPMEQ